MKKKKILAIVLATSLALSLGLVMATPAALAWQEGPSTNWWYIDASYGGWKYSVPLEIELNGNPAAGQTFYVGDTITISGDIHSYAAMCGWENEAYTEYALDVSGPSGSDSDTAWDYDYSGVSCAEVETITTPTITYTLTAPGTHTVYMSSYAAVAFAGTDVADDLAEDLLTFEVGVEVDIDIKPGSDPNSINPKSKGVIPVAILGSDTFDVTDVDVTTLRFGPDGAVPAHAGHLEDVNGDGFTDLVCHFRTQETGIAKGDTSATLTGQTTGGIPIAGTDSIRTVGKP